MYKLLMFFFLLSTSFIFTQDLVMNEIMSSNQSTLFDEDGDTPDWIELFNNGTAQINLNGYSLSDDTLNNQKWLFPDTIIDPGAYIIIFASGKDRNIDTLHTNFKISSAGESLFLSNTDGNIIDQIYVPAINSDISYARVDDGSLGWNFQTPSPGSSNLGNGFEGIADEVIFSMPSGFYSSSVSVELSAGTSNIFYTLDGSDPNSASTEYSAPINIQKTSVLKTISLKDGFIPGSIITNTYFINENTSLPVISLSTDPDNLFSADSGIYVHYEEDWERGAHVEFFDDDKNLGFSENVGINIYGGYTRRFDQKSLAVKFKSEYGKNKLDYDLFPGFKLKTFKSFILRNSGNDFDQTHIRDAFMQTLVKDLDIDYLEYRPAVTFINGEYWGIYNIREKISEHYIASRHGIDPDNIDMMEGYSAYNDDRNDPDGEYGLWVGNLNAVHGDTIAYKQLIDYLDTEDLTTDDAYQFINSTIDIDECLLYYAAHVYYNSQDWPSNNSKYWRERTPEGKWRWILYDLDFGFNLYEYNNEGNSEDHVDYLFSGDPSQRPWSKPVEATFIPRKIVENPKIKNQFVNLVADLLNSNFKTDRVLNIMNNIANHISDDIGRHRNLYNKNYDNLSRMISFAQERPENLRNHVRNFFDSGTDGQITINSNEGGKIKLNSLSFKPENLPWTGKYFQDNAVHISALPEAGYKFDGWSGTVTSDEPVLEVSGIRTINLTAGFSLDTTAANGIVINEINYNSSTAFETGDWVELYNKNDQSVDISNWTFTDSDTAHKFILPAGTILESNSYLVLVENDSAFTANFPSVTNYTGETGFGLQGKGELIMLMDNEGKLVDSLTYDNELPWPAEAAGLGATLELIDPTSDNSKAENWQASVEHGSPGQINTVASSIENKTIEIIPEKFSLEQNYPNPFNPRTIINYNLIKNNYTTLKVYDVLGREVAILVNGQQKAGTYKVEFISDNLSSGIYFYSLSSGEFKQTNKMILLR